MADDYIREGVQLTQDEAIEYDRLGEVVKYNDRIQHVKKIQLNSAYGALSNVAFRFYELLMAESTTASGRLVERHQLATANLLMTGVYDPEGAAIIGGDTDSLSGDAVVIIDGVEVRMDALFAGADRFTTNSTKEYAHYDDARMSATYDPEVGNLLHERIDCIYRHKVSKARYRVTDEFGNSVDVTDDHSIMVERAGNLIEVKASEIDTLNDLLIGVYGTMASLRQIRKVKIAKVEKLDDFKDEYVYDIVMHNTDRPWFFANNMLVHNSAFIKLDPDLTKEEAIAKADDTAAKVNATFPEFAKRTFMIPEERGRMINASREYVFAGGIWVKKKHYIGRVIDEEGKDINFIKVMGLAIKKTVLPRDKALLVENAVVRLIDGEPWHNVAADFVQLKDELKATEDLFGLGLPGGVNKVEHYTNAWRMDEKTRLPGRVAASIHYNEYIKEIKDHRSPPIVSGDKVKVFYLQAPRGRFKTIALPLDIEVVPDWFYELDIDLDAHVERLLDKPFDNIVTAIGESSPTHQTLLVDSLVEF